MIDLPTTVSQFGVASSATETSALYQDATWDKKRSLLSQDLQKQIDANNARGIETSVIVKDVTDGKTVTSYNTDYEHWAASDSKLYMAQLLLEDLRSGKISLDTTVRWQESDRRAGAGRFDVSNGPRSATVEELMVDMLKQSGNTAARVIVNKILGGAPAVNQRYESDPSLQVTRLIPLEGDLFLFGYTTAGETDYILQRLAENKDQYYDLVYNSLANNIFNDYGPRSQVQNKDVITVADKQGQLNDPEGNNRHDVGYITNSETGRTLRYVLMTTSFDNPAGETTNYAQDSLKAFGRSMLTFEGDAAASNSQNNTTRSRVISPLQNGRSAF